MYSTMKTQQTQTQYFKFCSLIALVVVTILGFLTFGEDAVASRRRMSWRSIFHKVGKTCGLGRNFLVDGKDHWMQAEKLFNGRSFEFVCYKARNSLATVAKYAAPAAAATAAVAATGGLGALGAIPSLLPLIGGGSTTAAAVAGKVFTGKKSHYTRYAFTFRKQKYENIVTAKKSGEPLAYPRILVKLEHISTNGYGMGYVTQQDAQYAVLDMISAANNNAADGARQVKFVFSKLGGGLGRVCDRWIVMDECRDDFTQAIQGIFEEAVDEAKNQYGALDLQIRKPTATGRFVNSGLLNKWGTKYQEHTIDFSSKDKTDFEEYRQELFKGPKSHDELKTENKELKKRLQALEAAAVAY